MLTETMQLEQLRQKIEAADSEAGNQSDYLDRGKPNAAQAQKAREIIEQMDTRSKTVKVELKEFIVRVRAEKPQAFEEWINLHTRMLQHIVEEKSTEQNAAVRRHVAQETLQEWAKVRAGEAEYVSINWHYLKDYREKVKKIADGSLRETDITSSSTSNGKAWWQFWK